MQTIIDDSEKNDLLTHSLSQSFDILMCQYVVYIKRGTGFVYQPTTGKGRKTTYVSMLIKHMH